MKPVLIAAVLLLNALPALAQEVDPGAVKAMAGQWLLARDDGSKGCVLTLGTETAIGGFSLAGAEACTGTVKALAEAAAWNFGGNADLYFLNPLRKKLATVVEGEDAIWSEANPKGAKLYMARVAPGVDHLPLARDVFGTFDMVRPGGQVICSVTFLNTPPPGGQESFALQLSNPCDAAVLSLKLASWKIEGPQLVLYGTDGNSLQFVPLPKGFAKAESEGGKPLNLVKRK